MKAIILAAGGDNLPPFTSSRPKPMIHLSGRYLLEGAIEFLRAAGVVDLILVVGHRKERIISHFGNGSGCGVRISYVSQEEEDLGIGNALLQAEDRILAGEYFLLVYGDVVTTGNSLLDAIARAEADGCTVSHAIVLVDRDEGGRQAVEAKGYKFWSLFTISRWPEGQLDIRFNGL